MILNASHGLISIMHMTRRHGFLFGILIMLCSLLAPLALADNSVILATTEFAPYMSQKLKGQGPLVAIATEAFRREGYTVQVRFLPWVRGLAYAKEGAVDGMAGIWHSSEREQWFMYGQSVVSNKIGFFERVDHPITFKALTDLRPYVIGTVRAYANPPAFDAAQLHTEEAVDDSTNLRKLAAGRLDLVLVDKAVAQDLIDQQLPELKDQLAWVEPPVDILPLYIAISRQTPNAAKKLAALNAGIDSMIHDGTMLKLLATLQ